MEGALPPEGRRDDDLEAAIDCGVQFLLALFVESDVVLFRPIETWVEGGKKKSRVDHRNTCYRTAVNAQLRSTIRELLRISPQDKSNLFFGVCPRVGTHGRFDLAWQIRTVRVLWTDIDGVTVEEALNRVTKAGLPQPSIVVSSGNGAHLYWLLDVPYQIADVNDPLAVETEWTETSGGRKKPRKYIVENGEKVYLDQQRHILRLSPTAEHVQDVLAGIAKAVGGDHVIDLARLLRIPGTKNRKDERNGKEPIPTKLVECDATRMYQFAVFEAFKSISEETQRKKHIAAMPLPKPRKTSASNADYLANLVAASSIAAQGSRSEADFAVCCFAIRKGIDKEEVWGQVQGVGKFAEQGSRYFDQTWNNAEFEVRAETFEKVQRVSSYESPRAKRPFDASEEGSADDTNERNSTGRPTIVVNPATMPVADTLGKVTAHLLEAGNCFIRANQLVAINELQILPILLPAELAGLLNQHVEFFFCNDDRGEYRPIPPAYSSTWLNHFIEMHRFPVITLFTRNPVYDSDWRLVAPGFNTDSGIYFSGPALEPRNGTEHLDALLRDFCFRSPADRTNYLGMLLTAILIPQFIGSKPAALFNGNQPELGKSILAQIISILRDGRPAETASYNPNDEEFEKRLGAAVRRGATTIIIDNAKGRGRNARIESACLERSITDHILSFRLLGHSETIRTENSHIFCITANSPDVSRDLVTRSIVINLYYEGGPERRRFSIADPEGYAQDHRNDLLGELLGMVERWKQAGKPQANLHSRFNKRGWANTVGGILEACGEPDFLANADEAAALLDDTRREFSELVAMLADHPQGVWTASGLVELCQRHGLLASDFTEGSSRSQSTKMGTLVGRFVGEQFSLADGRTAVFQRSDGRKGNEYRVFVHEFAEP